MTDEILLLEFFGAQITELCDPEFGIWLLSVKTSSDFEVLGETLKGMSLLCWRLVVSTVLKFEFLEFKSSSEVLRNLACGR